MYEASDLKKGLKVEIDGQPYVLTEFNFVKPGKGQGLYTCRLKNLITGSTMTKTYRSNDKLDKPVLEQRRLTYSFHEGSDYVFLDENYEEVRVSAETLGDQRYFLVENCEVDVLFYNHTRPIEFTLPTFVEKKVIDTEPGVRGDTATNVTKPATVEGGYVLNVAIFVDKGEIIRIDTRTGQYVERVR